MEDSYHLHTWSTLFSISHEIIGENVQLCTSLLEKHSKQCTEIIGSAALKSDHVFDVLCQCSLNNCL